MPSTNIGSTRGFTFLEVMIVMVLFALVATWGMPEMVSLLEKTPQIETKRLTEAINMLRNDSVLGQNTYYIIFNFKEQHYTVERELKIGGRAKLETSYFKKPHKFPEEFALVDFVLAANKEKSRFQPLLNFKEKPNAEIAIDSSGFVSPFEMVFQEDKKFWLIKSVNIMGRLEVSELPADARR